MNVLATQKRLRHDSDLSKFAENNVHGVIATSVASRNVQWGRVDQGGGVDFAVLWSVGSRQSVQLSQLVGEQREREFGGFEFGVPHLFPLVAVPALVASRIKKFQAVNHGKFTTAKEHVICVPVSAHQFVGLLGRLMLGCVALGQTSRDGVFPVSMTDSTRITSERRRERLAIESPRVMCVPKDSHGGRWDLLQKLCDEIGLGKITMCFNDDIEVESARVFPERRQTFGNLLYRCVSAKFISNDVPEDSHEIGFQFGCQVEVRTADYTLVGSLRCIRGIKRNR